MKENKYYWKILLTSVICIFAISIYTENGLSEVLVRQSFDSWTGEAGGTWGHKSYNGPSPGFPGEKVILKEDSSSPGTPSVLQFYWPEGWLGTGNSVGGAWICTETLTEFHVQYYVKFSSNFQPHTVTQKLTYFWPPSRDTHITTYGQPDTSGLWVHILSPSRNIYSTPRFYFNRNQWYKINYHYKMNTKGIANGIIRVWVNDVLRIDVNDALILVAGDNDDGFNCFDIEPIWGGQSSVNKSHEDYMWFDEFTLSSDSISGVLPNKKPNSASGIKIE